MIFCLQHNIDYVDKNSEKRCHMKEFEAFLAKAIEQKNDFGSVNFLPISYDYRTVINTVRYIGMQAI